MLDTHAIHTQLGEDGWREVLLASGIDERHLRNRHSPCPVCGGKDRFRFDNKGRGSFYCNQCGAGDGFKLLMRVHSIPFGEARRRVIEAAKLEGSKFRAERPSIPAPAERAEPTRRVQRLLRESCAIEDCDAAVEYLFSRSLWPLPAGHRLRAHPSVEYWQDRECVGRYPALVAAVRDISGELVTTHVTYLEIDGRKLQSHEPRKLLSPLTGREGCAAPVMELSGHELGIAEGIETALSAAKLTGIPVWAALNTALLSKFEPPPSIDKVVIFADRDIGGLDAATKLMQRLQERVRLEIRTPQEKDWNDALRAPA